jgi:hypothetical protein
LQDRSTDFEFLPIDVSLGRCLRYFHFLGGETAYQGVNMCMWYNSTQCLGNYTYPVTMRAFPTITKTGTWENFNSSGTVGQTINADQITTKNAHIGGTSGSGGSGSGLLRASNDSTFRLTFSSEL